PSALRSSAARDGRKEVGKRRPKRRDDARQGREADIALATLYRADVIAVEPRTFCEHFLRPTATLSQASQPLPHASQQIARHLPNRRDLDLSGLHTIVFMPAEAKRCLWRGWFLGH